MNVLILTTVYPPEVRSSAQLMYQLAESIHEAGHGVTVITSIPSEGTRQSRGLRDHFFRKEDQNGVTVFRISTLPIHRTNAPALVRGIGQILNAIGYFVVAFFLPKPHVSLAYSPPLTLGMAGILLRWTRGVPHVFNVQDLVPQYAIDLGILRNKTLIRLAKAIERFIYRRVDVITVHSQGNREYIVGEQVSPTEVHVIPNWVDTTTIAPSPRQNAFRVTHELTDKFVILFAGMLGFAQDVDTIVESASFLATRPDALFLIVGEGVEKNRLIKKATDLRLANVRFLPFVSEEQYPEVVAASDVCLATLQKSLRCPVVPSKILGYMAAARPVVVSFPMDGDAAAIIRNADCGICVEPGNPQQLAEAILSVYDNQDRASEWGRNGRHYVVAHHDRDVCLEQYDRLFQSLSRTR